MHIWNEMLNTAPMGIQFDSFWKKLDTWTRTQEDTHLPISEKEETNLLKISFNIGN